jgi:hypothetical protein
MATSSAAAAAAATTGGSSDIWNELEKQKVGGIGGSVPGAGVYLQQQAQAELAFNNAKAQLTAQKNRAFSQFGLTSEGAVDPMSQYGGYQQLLHNHAVDLMGASEHSVQRGLGAGSGLANQEEANLRYGQNAEDLDFQRGVADQESQYTQGAQGALQTRNAAFLDAQMQALANAIAQNAFAPAGSGGDSTPDWIAAARPGGVSGGQQVSQGEVRNVSSKDQLDTSGGWGVVWDGPGQYAVVKYVGANGRGDTRWVKVG